MAKEKGLDLFLVNPNQEPPVAKILDYGKYKFEADKKAKEAKKKQHTVEIKEIKMRYKIDVHDYNVRVKNIKRFLEEGNKVKILVMLRGREFQHADLAFDLVKRIEASLQEENVQYIADKKAALEGKNIVLMLSPSK